MCRRRMAGVVLIMLFSSCVAFGCSCRNGPPIQRTSERYRDRAVFTAHVIQLMGRIYNWDGKRLSSQVLAIVRERYWGLPWYWPRVVLLDGSYPCDIAMAEGEDYLVSGRRERYGILAVNLCSRTQPLATAQVDLRTLDGSHCAGPGGTIIGHVRRGTDRLKDNPSAANVTLRYRGPDGKTYATRSDGDGIYEVQHLRGGVYAIDSQTDQNQLVFSLLFSPQATVVEGTCTENDILIGQ